jgi:hypothetical protein
MILVKFWFWSFWFYFRNRSGPRRCSAFQCRPGRCPAFRPLRFRDAASVRRKFGGGKKQMRAELDTSPLMPLPGRGGEGKTRVNSAFTSFRRDRPRSSAVESTSPQPSDSFAPAHSARSGPLPPANSFRCFPSNSSPRSRRRGRSAGRFGAMGFAGGSRVRSPHRFFAVFALFCGKKSVSIGVHPWFPSSLRYDATSEDDCRSIGLAQSREPVATIFLVSGEDFYAEDL